MLAHVLRSHQRRSFLTFNTADPRIHETREFRMQFVGSPGSPVRPLRKVDVRDVSTEDSAQDTVRPLMVYWRICVPGVITRYYSNRGVSFSFRRVP